MEKSLPLITADRELLEAASQRKEAVKILNSVDRKLYDLQKNLKAYNERKLGFFEGFFKKYCTSIYNFFHKDEVEIQKIQNSSQELDKQLNSAGESVGAVDVKAAKDIAAKGQGIDQNVSNIEKRLEGLDAFKKWKKDKPIKTDTDVDPGYTPRFKF